MMSNSRSIMGIFCHNSLSQGRYLVIPFYYHAPMVINRCNSQLETFERVVTSLGAVFIVTGSCIKHCWGICLLPLPPCIHQCVCLY
jgi:hypothetical protein